MSKKPHKIAKHGSVSVPIYRTTIHGKPRFQVVWNENGRRVVKQRTNEAKAIKLAEDAAMELARHGNAESRIVSRESYRALCRLQRLADNKDMHALLSELEAAKDDLHGASWLEAARFWKTHAPENFEEKTVADVFVEYMALFEDRPQKARSGVRSKVKKFVDCFGSTYIGMFAGLRPFELAYPGQERSVRWEDLDFEKGYIRVRAEVDGKNRTTRYVKMRPNLMEWLLPHRKRKGKVAMTRASVKVSEDLRKKGVIKSWEADIMRHSFCSYLLAREQNIALVAEQAGNSPDMIRKHYRRPLTQEEGEAWFEIRPQVAEAEGAEVA
jgi:hypothetical protein